MLINKMSWFLFPLSSLWHQKMTFPTNKKASFKLERSIFVWRIICHFSETLVSIFNYFSAEIYFFHFVDLLKQKLIMHFIALLWIIEFMPVSFKNFILGTAPVYYLLTFHIKVLMSSIFLVILLVISLSKKFKKSWTRI